MILLTLFCDIRAERSRIGTAGQARPARHETATPLLPASCLFANRSTPIGPSCNGVLGETGPAVCTGAEAAEARISGRGRHAWRFLVEQMVLARSGWLAHLCIPIDLGRLCPQFSTPVRSWSGAEVR